MQRWGSGRLRSDRVSPSSISGQADRSSVGTTTLRNVQGLRGVAALIVVMAHVSGNDGFEERVFGSSWTSWSNLPANTGVDLFFVISGLIMVVTTWRTFDAPGSSSRFLLRRIARIYPLYWVVNTAIVVLFLVSPSSVNFNHGDTPSLLQSYFLLPQEGRLPVLVAWSLVYEMYFYLVFTIAMMMGRPRFLWVMGAWVTLTLTLSTVVPDATNPYVMLVASPLSFEFVLGVLIGLAVVHGRFVLPTIVLTLGIFSYSASLGFLALSGWQAFPSDPVRVSLVALPVGLLVYGAIGLEVSRGRVVPTLMQRLGNASYSLYLTHVSALTLLAVLLAGHLPTTAAAHAAALPVVLIVVVVGAAVCYRLVERPLQVAARRVLQRLVRPEKRLALADRSADGPQEN